MCNKETLLGTFEKMNLLSGESYFIHLSSKRELKKITKQPTEKILKVLAVIREILEEWSKD